MTRAARPSRPAFASMSMTARSDSAPGIQALHLFLRARRDAQAFIPHQLRSPCGVSTALGRQKKSLCGMEDGSGGFQMHVAANALGPRGSASWRCSSGLSCPANLELFEPPKRGQGQSKKGAH